MRSLPALRYPECSKFRAGTRPKKAGSITLQFSNAAGSFPISYSGRTYDEGKKITWRDGVAALWWIFRYRFFG